MKLLNVSGLISSNASFLMIQPFNHPPFLLYQTFRIQGSGEIYERYRLCDCCCCSYWSCSTITKTRNIPNIVAGCLQIEKYKRSRLMVSSIAATSIVLPLLLVVSSSLFVVYQTRMSSDFHEFGTC